MSGQCPRRGRAITLRAEASPYGIAADALFEQIRNVPDALFDLLSRRLCDSWHLRRWRAWPPVSHGCVRLSPAHAAQLFHMVQSEGARISISGTPPRSIR